MSEEQLPDQDQPARPSFDDWKPSSAELIARRRKSKGKLELELDLNLNVSYRLVPAPPLHFLGLTVVGPRRIPGTPVGENVPMANPSVTANCPSDEAMQFTLTPLSAGGKPEPLAGAMTFVVDPTSAASVAVVGPNAANASAVDILVVPSTPGTPVVATVTASSPPNADGTVVADCVFAVNFTEPDATQVVAQPGSPVPIPTAGGGTASGGGAPANPNAGPAPSGPGGTTAPQSARP